MLVQPWKNHRVLIEKIVVINQKESEDLIREEKEITKAIDKNRLQKQNVIICSSNLKRTIFQTFIYFTQRGKR